jgi:hypothetical protein
VARRRPNRQTLTADVSLDCASSPLVSPIPYNQRRSFSDLPQPQPEE